MIGSDSDRRISMMDPVHGDNSRNFVYDFLVKKWR